MSAALSFRCPDEVVEGRLITKEKRQELFGQVAGGAGSTKPERFQRQMIEKGTGIRCPKTKMRINLRTNTMKEIAHPNKADDGFDYSEDFDGKQTIKTNDIYLNLKMIVGTGGVQTRSLREVYAFVEGQLGVCETKDNVYFANILDGDVAHSVLSKFAYLLSKHEAVKKRVYVGDLKGYFEWLKATFE